MLPSLFFRRLFRAAAVYNAAFLVWTVLAPGQFFELIGMTGAEPFHWLWQCIGMVVGIYGLLYWHVGNHLDRGRPIVFVGLLGKVLGPLGWVWHFAHGSIPAASFVLILLNDLAWWPGFGAYLLRDRSPRARYHFLLLVLLAAHAGGALLLLPVELSSALAIAESARSRCWSLAWASWCIADLFSPAFVLQTFRRRVPHGSRAHERMLRALIFGAAGGDLVLNAGYAAFVAPAAPGQGPVSDPTLRLLSLTGTNGLFLLAYLVLSAALWRSDRVPRWLTLLGLPAWAGAFGICLEGFGLLSGAGLVFGGLLVVFFCLWLLGLLFTDGG